jgi:hypothetical protein
MKIWSDMMDKVLSYLENIYNNQQLYYGIMLALLIVWLILFVILIKLMLNKKNNKSVVKPLIEPIILNEDEHVEDNNDLETLLNKMEEDLENKENVVKTFEDEQEEKAIISYQELVEISGKNTQAETVDEEQEEEFNLDFTIIDSPKKFKNTEFISPVYGRVDSDVNHNDEETNSFEETIVEQPIEEDKPIETQSNVEPIEEFLNELKRFRKNLE